MLVSRSKTRATKDISRENKKSETLFLLTYYHNLNLFTRDDSMRFEDKHMQETKVKTIT